MNDYKFGNFLYERRTAKGLSQAELGSMLGVSNKAVSKWESGAAKPQTAKLIRLAEILEVTVEELLLGERIPPSEQPCNKESFEPSPKDAMIRQWLHTSRVAKFFTWALLLILIQIPFVTGFLVAVLHVSDDVGAAYTLCTILLLLISSIIIVVYRISATKQKKTLFRLFAIDTTTFEKPTKKDRMVSSPLSEPPSHPFETIAPSSHYKILCFENKQISLLKWWLIIAAIPVFAYILLVLLSLTEVGWETFLFFVTVLYLSWSILFIVLPLYTVLSCIIIWKNHKKLCADCFDEYQTYRKEKKQMATKQTKLQIVAITLYSVMMIFYAIRIFSTSNPIQLWLYAGVFFVLFSDIIVVLCVLSHRIQKKLNACLQNKTDHD